MLEDVSGLLAASFASDFEPYVAYCANQVYQDRALRFLKFPFLFFLPFPWD